MPPLSHAGSNQIIYDKNFKRTYEIATLLSQK